MRRPAVIGNWKMNGDCAFARELLSEIADSWHGIHTTEIAVCPPYPYLAIANEVLEQTNIYWGAQDVSKQQSNGAFTGEISATMLSDMGCKYVIVGHSERREYHTESSATVAVKFKVAVENQLTPVLCVGESLEEREANKTFDVISDQVSQVIDYCGLDAVAQGVIAYEPIWAIGTGKSATPEMAQEVHAHIRGLLGEKGNQIKILYGGSVKPNTAEALFNQADIDGALVGGASLKAKDFVDICRAAE